MLENWGVFTIVASARMNSPSLSTLKERQSYIKSNPLMVVTSSSFLDSLHTPRDGPK